MPQNNWEIIGRFHVNSRQKYFGAWATKVLTLMFETLHFRSLNEGHEVIIYVDEKHPFDIQFLMRIANHLFDVYLVIK